MKLLLFLVFVSKLAITLATNASNTSNTTSNQYSNINNTVTVAPVIDTDTITTTLIQESVPENQSQEVIGLGPTGATGATGATGEQGLKGERGEEGSKGDIGPRGYAGRDGFKGDQGPEGPEGAAGEDGRNGRDAPIAIDDVLRANNNDDKIVWDQLDEDITFVISFGTTAFGISLLNSLCSVWLCWKRLTKGPSYGKLNEMELKQMHMA
tara:strand:- start:3424 stop:4053 length:630 start_codon:yes stop_codon:yes gene_type:complete